MTRLNEIEAILFASGNSIPIADLRAKMPDITDEDMDNIINALASKYSGDSGIILIMVLNNLQLCTNNKYSDVISDVLKKTKERELSRTLLETLAIIAYNQPITKGEVELVRNQACDYPIYRLSQLNLIEIIGRKEKALGRPFLYATTEDFLKRFSLKSLEELPDRKQLENRIKAIDKESENNQLFIERLINDENIVVDNDIL